MWGKVSKSQIGEKKMRKMTSTFIVALSLVTSFFCAQARAERWDYYTDTDKMTDKTWHRAVIQSSNSLNLAWPYAGVNHGRLLVHKRGTNGLAAGVTIDKGQILCPSSEGCSVKVKFGDGQPVPFKADGTADHNPKMIVFRHPELFIALAKTAKTIKVQMTIYQSGAPVLEFETPSPLVWDMSAEIPQSKASKKEK